AVIELRNGKRGQGEIVGQEDQRLAGSQSVQTSFDVAQALAPSQLGKGHDRELFVAGKLADTKVAAIALNTLVEFVFGQAVQELRENSATFVHTEFGPLWSGARPCERTSLT